VGSLRRRRPGKEGKYKEELSAYRLRGSRYPGRDKNSARQKLWKGWLNDQVNDVAKRAIRLDCLSVRVHVPGLHDSAESDEYAAKEAEHHPQQMTCC
jgi:hypothetical protein